MDIKNILAKYENFYKGGSGYTFQFEVDDFNEIVKYIEVLEDMTLEEIVELKKENKRLLTKNNKLIKRMGIAFENDELVEENIKLKEIERKEKKTIATILAYVEKNHDAPEIEEYLWKMLDKGTEFE